MRTVFLLPLTALVAVAAGCGSEAREQRRSVPERDLTLVTQTAYVEIASPVETQVRRAPTRPLPHPSLRSGQALRPSSLPPSR